MHKQIVKNSVVKKGILYGILPHSFCIAFIVLSIIGASALTTILKPFLLNVYFFPLLILLSIALATLSAVIYLKRGGGLSFKTISKNRNYLLILYSSVIGVNLVLFLVVFPMVANFGFSNTNTLASAESGFTSKTIAVQIPCSGHAPLIMEELKKVNGVTSTRYIPLNKFEIRFDSQKTSLEKILSLEIFKSFKASEVYGN